LAYFQRTADKHGLRPHIRFQTSVVETRFDEAAGRWRTKVRDKDGAEAEIVSNAVVSAVGQLNQPKMPDIEGMDRFKGPSFHSARWPKDFDPTGKTIAVIGTGASAFQFVPKIAPLAKRLTVFQRTPPWLAPTANYHEDVGAGKKALLEHLPYYDKWYRFYLFWTMTDGVYEAVKADEDWRGPETAVGEANAMLREMLVEQIRPQTNGREDLLDKVTPNTPSAANERSVTTASGSRLCDATTSISSRARSRPSRRRGCRPQTAPCTRRTRLSTARAFTPRAF
jgi:4-hydroxyacetophenone monooxygenase